MLTDKTTNTLKDAIIKSESVAITKSANTVEEDS